MIQNCIDLIICFISASTNNDNNNRQTEWRDQTRPRHNWEQHLKEQQEHYLQSGYQPPREVPQQRQQQQQQPKYQQSGYQPLPDLTLQQQQQHQQKYQQSGYQPPREVPQQQQQQEQRQKKPQPNFQFAKLPLQESSISTEEKECFENR